MLKPYYLSFENGIDYRHRHRHREYAHTHTHTHTKVDLTGMLTNISILDKRTESIINTNKYTPKYLGWKYDKLPHNIHKQLINTISLLTYCCYCCCQRCCWLFVFLYPYPRYVLFIRWTLRDIQKFVEKYPANQRSYPSLNIKSRQILWSSKLKYIRTKIGLNPSLFQLITYVLHYSYICHIINVVNSLEFNHVMCRFMSYH